MDFALKQVLFPSNKEMFLTEKVFAGCYISYEACFQSFLLVHDITLD